MSIILTLFYVHREKCERLGNVKKVQFAFGYLHVRLMIFKAYLLSVIYYNSITTKKYLCIFILFGNKRNNLKNWEAQYFYFIADFPFF